MCHQHMGHDDGKKRSFRDDESDTHSLNGKHSIVIGAKGKKIVEISIQKRIRSLLVSTSST